MGAILSSESEVLNVSKDFNNETDEEFIIINNEEKKHQIKKPNESKQRTSSTINEVGILRPKMLHSPGDPFLLACKNSYISIQPRNIIIMGQTGAGKSSTTSHLLGKKLPKYPSSTDLIKVDPGIYWQSKGSHKFRKVSKKNEIEAFKTSILIGAEKTENITRSCLLPRPPQKPRATSTPQPDYSDTTDVANNFVDDLKKVVTKEIINADLRDLPLSNYQQDTISLYQFIDCGGMPFFRNLLPQFFPSAENTIFLIVHKLTDKLYANAQIRVLKNGRLVHQEELPSSNIDEISNWLKIAHSCSKSLVDENHIGNTFMIGTHFDHLQQLCFNSRSLALEAAFAATEDICERVISHPTHCVLDPEPIFLKNDLAGTDECPGIQKLRKKLWEYKSLSKPIRLKVMWCACINCIRELAEKSPVLHIDEFFKIAKRFYISETEAWEVLGKCQELCLVFHLSSTSYFSKYVFIDMQWLFTSLAKILHRPDSYSKRGQHFSDWKELSETGFINLSFHTHLFFRTPQIECLPSTWASDLLEQLHLMSRVSLIKGNGFFCPILLPITSDYTNEHDPFHKDSDTDALHIIPQNQCVPPGYLARLFSLIASIPDRVQLVYCSSQTSATFQLFTDNPNENYFVRISEDRGGIRLEFCNVFTNQMGMLRACSIANRILLMVINASEVLRKVWKLVPTLDCPVILENNSKGFPTLFMKCYNSNCCYSYHLARIHPQPLNKSKPYVQCSLNQNRMLFSDLPVSQLIWLIKLVKEDEGRHLKHLIGTTVENNTLVDRTIYTYPMRHSFPQLGSGHALITDPTRLSLTLRSSKSHILPDEYVLQPHLQALKSLKNNSTPQSDSILDSYFILLEDNLDLDICDYLFQFGVLNNDKKTKIQSINATVNAVSLQPNSRASAIRTLIDILKASKAHGFMAFITALEYTTDSVLCSHYIILDHMQKDSNFMKIKRSWLISLTIH